MSLDKDLSQFSMHDLFRMEAREQARVLTDGLLLLERGDAGDPGTLAAMMRAAHSIKGAAAIVGMQPGVRLAHALEDVLIAAQAGKVVLDPRAADGMLDAVDLLRHLSELPEGAIAHDPGALRLPAVLDALAALKTRAALPAGTSGAAADGAMAAPPAQAAPAAPASPEPPAAAQPPATLPPAPEPPPDSPPGPGAGQPGSPQAAPPPAQPEPEPATVQREPRPVTASPAQRPAAAGPGEDLLTLAGQARLHAANLRPWIERLHRYKRHQRSVYEGLDQLRAAIAAGSPRVEELARQLAERAAPLRETLHATIADAENYERQAVNVSARLVDQVQELHMCRFGGAMRDLPRMVRDLGRGLGKDVRLVVDGDDTLVERVVLARMEAALNQLLRNAVDHGIESPQERRAAGKPDHGTIRLAARHRGGMLEIEISDDGRGVDPERIRLAAVRRQLATPAFAPDLDNEELMEFLFLPGFSLKEGANETSGRGVGMDIVLDAARRQNGTARATSRPGLGFSTLITLPQLQSIVRALLVEVAGEAYALPVVRIERVLRLPAERVRTLGGREYFELDGQHVGLMAASRVLDLGAAPAGDEWPVVLIGAGRERYGLVVDAVRGEHSLTVQPLEPTFGKLRDIAAAALLDDGTPALILDVPDLLLSVARLLDEGGDLGLSRPGPGRASARRVLVVDDSLTVREMQRKLLAAQGYQVDVAIDGIDGWNQLRAGDYDLVISDIDMPRLDGIALVERIRADARLDKLPVMIVSYKDRQEDRARGLAAGADHYLTKGAFHDATLLGAVRDLIGAADAPREDQA